MENEKKVTVTIEHDGEERSLDGIAGVIVSVDKEGCSSETRGYISKAEGYALIDALSSQAAHIADHCGIAHSVALAVAEDSFKRVRASLTLDRTIAEIERFAEDFGDCEGGEEGEDDQS